MKHIPEGTEEEALALSSIDRPPLGPPLSASPNEVSSGEEDDREWDAELLRRVTDIRNGTAQTFSA